MRVKIWFIYRRYFNIDIGDGEHGDAEAAHVTVDHSST